MPASTISLHLAAAVQDLSLLKTIAAAFAAAWLFGLLAQRLHLSPIVGYLVGGIVIGPYTPGFIADVNATSQLAEIGVILLMFGVGLHFDLSDLWRVRRIAFPGAVGQIVVAALATLVMFGAIGWDVRAGLLFGLALAVASTVTLLRALNEHGLMRSSEGHVAVGWLIVEDLASVVVLAVVPVLAGPVVDASTSVGDPTDASSAAGSIGSMLWAILRLVAMVLVVFVGGSWIIPRLLRQVARLRSAELLTLTILVFSVAIAVGAAVLFGASVALGVFLAGMVVAQSPVSLQAGADALPLRDAFGVLFFVSIGMPFDPEFLLLHPGLVAAGLAVVLVIKPLAALVIVAALGHPPRMALTVAIGLAQIGEFSFILAGAASQFGLLPSEATHVLVATAILSIAVNPLLFAKREAIEALLEKSPRLWRLLNARHGAANAVLQRIDPDLPEGASHAIIVGYGPVGRIVDALLRDAGIATVVVDLNVDTVERLREQGRLALFGDARREAVLNEARIAVASHVIFTLPQTEGKPELVGLARRLNASAHITVRARYLAELDELTGAGASSVILDEGEVGLALAKHVLTLRGTNDATAGRLMMSLRHLWRLGST
jgi:CPA2 family monovalent cation:H+ antiporter-2